MLPRSGGGDAESVESNLSANRTILSKAQFIMVPYFGYNLITGNHRTLKFGNFVQNNLPKKKNTCLVKSGALQFLFRVHYTK